MIQRTASSLRATMFVVLFAFLGGISTAQAEVTEPRLTLVKNEAANQILMVFVHGIRSDATDAWTNARTGAYWPDLVAADTALAHVNVATFEYPASALSKDGLRINEVGRNLKVFLDPQMRRHDKVVFVAHSMGGLVVRAMLLNFRDSFDTPLALFLAVPTAGSDLANWAQALRLGRSNAFVEGLRELQQNDALEAWISQWAAWNGGGRPKVLCAYERIRTAGVFVVEQAGMLPGCDDVPLGVAANHSDIAKPSSASAILHQYLSSAIQALNSETFVPRLQGNIRLTDARGLQDGLLIARTITLEADVTLPSDTRIFAQNIFLNGHKLIGKHISILADTVADGIIQSATTGAGGNAGDIMVVARRLSGVELVARGTDGGSGRNGADGNAGAPGGAGREGRCDGFGKWRAAHAGGNGGNGTPGGLGENGSNGGNGGRIFVATVLQSGVLADVSAGRGGAAGQGGQGGQGGSGGPGGRGCTGLGGTQSNAATGRDGIDGIDGRNGRPGTDGLEGTIWRAEVDRLSVLPAVAALPSSDQLPDYATVLLGDLKTDVRLAASN